MISPLAYVDAKAQIGNNVTIHPFAYVDKNVVIGDNCEILPYASVLAGTTLGKNNRVFQGAILGAEPQDFRFKGETTRLTIGNNNVIREYVVINRATFCSGKTVIGSNNSFMEGVHVSHDTKISDNCVFGYGTKIAGDCEIENDVIFSSNVIANARVRVGRGSMIQGGSRLSRDVPPYIVAADNPVKYGGINASILTNHGVTQKVQDHIANAYRLVFHGQTSVFDAVRQIREQVPDGPEVRHIIEFIDATKLGLISKMW